MGATINTNLNSLAAQRNSTKTQNDLTTSIARLSSGLRINSAKDDAAGLAISERFTTQIRGLNQAVRNANDGISLAQTAESALGELTSNLQRIRELAVQSANSTNSASDRAALDQEVQQRLAEINRIASQTAFNGLKVLDGSFGTSQFQVGANAGETISINLSQGVKSNQIGQIAEATGTVTNAALAAGTLSITVGDGTAVDIAATVDGPDAGQNDESAYAKAAAINAAGIQGLTATATNEPAAGAVTSAGGSAGDTYTLTINGVDIFDAANAATAITGQQIVDRVNENSKETGVTATLSGGNVSFVAEDGRDITIAQTSAAGGLAGGLVATHRGTVSLSASDKITLTGAGAVSFGFTDGQEIALGTEALSSADVLTVDGANDALKRVDAALTTVNGLRSTFGAIQNRFESTINNLQAVSENLSASRSRILDADFAAETAQLTRAQILQQAGTAILAQANSVPQNVLSLLR